MLKLELVFIVFMIIFILLTATLRVSITLHVVLRRNSIVRLKLLLFLGEGVWGGLMFLHFITVVGFGRVEDDISEEFGALAVPAGAPSHHLIISIEPSSC